MSQLGVLAKPSYEEKSIEKQDTCNNRESNVQGHSLNPLRRSAKSRKSFKRQWSFNLKPKVTQHSPAEKDDISESDPLEFLEINSAAQWRSISQKVSWNFDNDAYNNKKEQKHEDNIAIVEKGKKDFLSDNSKVTIRVPSKMEFPADLDKTTLAQLRNICWRFKPWNVEKRDGLFTSVFGQGWGVDCDEIVKGLFIGDKSAISNVPFLNKQKISCVLNAAEGNDEGNVAI